VAEGGPAVGAVPGLVHPTEAVGGGSRRIENLTPGVNCEPSVTSRMRGAHQKDCPSTGLWGHWEEEAWG